MRKKDARPVVKTAELRFRSIGWVCVVVWRKFDDNRALGTSVITGHELTYRWILSNHILRLDLPTGTKYVSILRYFELL
jgi:hypothetical protein